MTNESNIEHQLQPADIQLKDDNTCEHKKHKKKKKIKKRRSKTHSHLSLSPSTAGSSYDSDIEADDENDSDLILDEQMSMDNNSDASTDQVLHIFNITLYMNKNTKIGGKDIE